jgi:hypothetical protein
MKVQFNTVEAVAAAIAAMDINNNQVVRTSSVDQETQIVTRSNRSLVEGFLQGSSELSVTDDHRHRAQEVIQYLQQTAMLRTLMGSKSDEFLNTINEMLEKATLKDIGLLVWAPKVFFEYKKKDSIKEVSSKFERSSRYIGTVGGKITTDFTLIESRFVTSVGCFAVYGHTKEDNLVFYWAKNEEKIVKSGTVSARIKAHRKETYRGGACVTVLNYVKSV